MLALCVIIILNKHLFFSINPHCVVSLEDSSMYVISLSVGSVVLQWRWPELL